MRARLGESSPDALDRADREAMAYECVQRDPARDDVAARLFPRQADRIEHFRLVERQLVSATRPAERPATLVVTISDQAAAGDRIDSLDVPDWATRLARP